MIGLFVSGVIGGHVTHRCAARSVIGLFVSGVIGGHVTLTGARLVQ